MEAQAQAQAQDHYFAPASASASLTATTAIAIATRANEHQRERGEGERSTTLQIFGVPNDIFSTQNLTFQFPRFMETPTYDHRLLEWATPIYPPVPVPAAAAAAASSPPTDYHIHYPHPHPHPQSHPHPGPSYPHSSSTTSMPFEFLAAYTAARATAPASESLGSHTLQIQARHDTPVQSHPTNDFHFRTLPLNSAAADQGQVQPQDESTTRNTTFTTNTTTSQTPGLESIPRPIFTTLGPLLPNGLPIYSASGFDMLDILARVATRPNPKVSLGPVDMTASFVVVDTTKHDHPIVHVSPGFTHLTGYTEADILGRNCRFLQAPPHASVEKASQREFTDQDAVAKLAQSLAQNKECQVSLLNYHKSGRPFINCLTVIPLCLGPGTHARYHVGFQVDLATQPRAIMDSVKNGTYILNYTATHAPTGASLLSRLITKDMMGVLGTIYPEKAGQQYDEARDREDLSKALVQFAADPILVLSLKGHFLYVSPAVSRVFGYDPDWFVGKNLTDLCHPSDQVATMRALKETSPTSGRPTLTNDNEAPDERPGTVHLLFRARINTNTSSTGKDKDKGNDGQEYIWVECPSRLHTDGARGRKAVIVHVRRREVPRVSWSSINASDGIARDDVWIRIARDGRADGRALVLDASENALRVLGRAPDELIGASLMDLLVDDAHRARREALRAAIAHAASAPAGDEVAKTAWCSLPVVDRGARRDIASEEDEKDTTENGTGTGSGSGSGSVPKLAVATVEIAVFPPKPSTLPIAGEAGAWQSTPRSMICRLRVKSKREVADANCANHGSKVQPPQQQAYSGRTLDPSTFIPVHPFSYSYLSSVGTSTSTSSSGSTAHLSGSLTSIRAPNSNAVKVLRTGNATDVVDCTTAISTASSSTAEPTTTTTSGTGMDSSWQYELSLLRNRNDKLRADVAVMEKERNARRKHRRKMGSLSVGAPAGARLINGAGAGAGGIGGTGMALGLGLSQQQWVVQQQQAHLHDEASKVGNTTEDVHMAFPGEEHLHNLKRTRKMAGFEIGVPPPPTWNPGGGSWRV